MPLKILFDYHGVKVLWNPIDRSCPDEDIAQFFFPDEAMEPFTRYVFKRANTTPTRLTLTPGYPDWMLNKT